MSLTQDAADTDTGGGSQPRLSGGERLAVIVGTLITVLAVAGIGFLIVGDRDEATPAAPVTVDVDDPTDTAPVDDPAQTPEDLAAAEAEQRYREFLRVDDEVGRGGYQSSDAYDAVSVAPERAYRETLFRNARQLNGARLVGSKEVASLTVVALDLTPEPGGYPKVVLQACVDVSGIDVLDAEGRSLVSPDRLDRSKSIVTMYRYEPGTKGAEAGGWYVYEATSKAEPC